MGNYVTRDELVSYLNIRQQHVEGFDELDSAITAAEAILEDYCGRVFVADSSPTARIYKVGSNRLVIDDVAVTGTAVVETSDDRETWSTYTGTYWFEAPDSSWPATRWETSDYVSCWLRITATHGWSTVPDPVPAATKLIAAQLHSRRNSPNGIEAFGEMGGAVRASRYIDGHAELALRPYRRVEAFAGIA